jgi:hypothetical protein
LRTNIQEDTSFLQRFKFVDPLDFYFDIDRNHASPSRGRISLSQNNFSVFIHQKPSWFVKTKNGKTINSISDDASTRYYGSYTPDGSTDEYKNVTVFSYSNQFFTTFDGDTGITVDYSFCDVEEYDWTFADIEEDAYTDGKLVVRKNGKIYSFDILKSFKDYLILKGNCVNTINGSNYCSVILYEPDECNFIYTNIAYESQRKRIKKSRITDSGDIVYGPVSLPIESNKPSELICNVKDLYFDFGGVSKKVEVSSETLFYYLGFDESSITLSASVESVQGLDINSSSTNKISISSGGLFFSNFQVPDRYSSRILYLDIDYDSTSDVLVLSVVENDGTVTEYRNSSSNWLVFNFSSNGAEIRIDQSKVNYKTISVGLRSL